MTTSPTSFLLSYTGGRPVLEVIDLAEGRAVPLATPADQHGNAVDHALIREDYVALHSGTEFAFSIPLDLRGAAAPMGTGWASVPALDDRLIWLQSTSHANSLVPHLLVDRVGTVVDAIDLPYGTRVIGETAAGLVVAGDGTVGMWDRAQRALANERPAWSSKVVGGRWVVSLFNEQLTLWDTRDDDVVPVTLPDSVEWALFPRSSPTGSALAWASGNYSSAHRAIVVWNVSTGEIQIADTGFNHVGSLCWSADGSRIFFASWDDRVVRSLPIGGDTHDITLRRAPGNLLCDLGDLAAPITSSRLLVDFDGAAPGRIASTTSERSLRRDAGAALRDTVGRSAAKAILGIAQPALLLEPDDGGQSWVGGAPLLESGLDWPQHDGRPLSHLATLKLHDLRRAWRGSSLPPKGQLAFFFGPVDEDGTMGEASTVIRSGPRAKLHTHPPEDLVQFESVPVRPRLVLTLPVDLDEVVDQAAAEAAEVLFEELFGITGRRHQVAGHPRWIQPPEVGSLLLQVDSDSEAGMTWGDGGMVYFLRPSATPNADDFTHVSAIMQCF